MAGEQRLICASADLVEGGDGVRFSVPRPGGEEPAFVVRHAGVVRGYLNRCAHVPVQLDWVPGRFFDDGRRYIICATHGALYEPAGGYCVAGPCRGRTLVRLAVEERDDGVYFLG